MTTLYEVQRGGTLRVAAVLADLYLPANIHGNEIPNIQLTSTQEDITIDPTYGTPEVGHDGGAFERQLAMTFNTLSNTPGGLYRKLRTAHLANTPLWLSATLLPGVISEDNEEAVCQFKVLSLDLLGGQVGQKKTQQKTWPVVTGTLVYNTVPPIP